MDAAQWFETMRGEFWACYNNARAICDVDAMRHWLDALDLLDYARADWERTH